MLGVRPIIFWGSRVKKTIKRNKKNRFRRRKMFKTWLFLYVIITILRLDFLKRMSVLYPVWFSNRCYRTDNFRIIYILYQKKFYSMTFRNFTNSVIIFFQNWISVQEPLHILFWPELLIWWMWRQATLYLYQWAM